MNTIGELAPTFLDVDAYKSGEFITISSEEYYGKWLVLFFYPRDFTFVCPTELREFAKHEADFLKENCAILACSTDSKNSHKAWFEKDLPEVTYPILADTNHAITLAYGILKSDGAAHRGTFIIDPEGIVRWMMVSDNSVGRSVKEVLRAVQALQTGELCPAEWHEGDATL